MDDLLDLENEAFNIFLVAAFFLFGIQVAILVLQRQKKAEKKPCEECEEKRKKREATWTP